MNPMRDIRIQFSPRILIGEDVDSRLVEAARLTLSATTCDGSISAALPRARFNIHPCKAVTGIIAHATARGHDHDSLKVAAISASGFRVRPV